MLAVHFMAFYVVRLYGAERPQPDVQQYFYRFRPALSYFFEQFGREMQSRRRRRARTVEFCVYRLIARAVFRLFVYVRGQRHLPDFIESRFKRTGERKSYRSFPCFARSDDGAG